MARKHTPAPAPSIEAPAIASRLAPDGMVATATAFSPAGLRRLQDSHVLPLATNLCRLSMLATAARNALTEVQRHDAESMAHDLIATMLGEITALGCALEDLACMAASQTETEA